MYGRFQINQISVEFGKKEDIYGWRIITFPLDKYITQPPISLHDQSKLE